MLNCVYKKNALKNCAKLSGLFQFFKFFRWSHIWNFKEWTKHYKAQGFLQKLETPKNKTKPLYKLYVLISYCIRTYFLDFQKTDYLFGFILLEFRKTFGKHPHLRLFCRRPTNSSSFLWKHSNKHNSEKHFLFLRLPAKTIFFFSIVREGFAFLKRKF